MRNDDLSRRIGRRIREERKNLGLTQEQLAERAGLSTNFIAHLERGSRGASLGTIEKMASILGVTVAALFVGTMERNPLHADRGDVHRLTIRLGGLDKNSRELVFRVAEMIERWGRARLSRRPR